MEDPDTLAQRLADGLQRLVERGPLTTDKANADRLADTAARLSAQFKAMPDETRRLLHTADSGFASSGAWVDDAIVKQDQHIHNIARATRVMSAWIGPDGLAAERVFLMRGNIRAWAHRWRTENKGPAQVDSDPKFVAFATDCLRRAGIDGDAAQLIANALRKDWREAPYR